MSETDITPAVVADFRVAFPAFSQPATWPEPVITAALYEADAETGSRRWGVYDASNPRSFKRRGMFNYTAHYLTVTYPKGAVDDTNVSAQPGAAASSKSVGDESINLEVGGSKELAAGDSWFATTSYGQTFLRLRRRAGMGAMNV